MKKEITIINNTLFYNNFDLVKLAKEYQTPLRVTFLDVIRERVIELKNAFNYAIEKNSYKGKFIYANANKANYEYLEIKEAYVYSDSIETSSYYDLLYTKEIVSKFPFGKEKPIICNGIKGNDYLNLIIKMSDEGFKIIDICDSLEEYLYLKNEEINSLEIGLRIHLSSLYEEESDDRFGMSKEEFDFIIQDISNVKSLYLSTIHFHQRGFDFEKEKFELNIKRAFKYYVNAYNKLKTLKNFNIGGGTPLPYNDTFNYIEYANNVIQLIKELANENNVLEPNIISENGKYSQKDSTINIYKVVKVKNTGKYPWYVLDGSLLIAMPEMYALGEEILVLPINNLNKEKERAKLSSLTCDCDDIYFDKKTGYMILPKYQKDDDLYIGIFGTGSYQNSMSGKGGWHHCLLPEEKDLVVYTENNQQKIIVRSELQSIEKIKKLVHFE